MVAGMWDFLFSADFLLSGFDCPVFFLYFLVQKYRNITFSSFFLARFFFFFFFFMDSYMPVVENFP